jgi:type III secretory pathway component EscR
MKPVPVIEVVMEEKKTDIQKKEEHITNYIKAMVAVEEEMEPYKEHKRELKKNYIENEWLTKEEISLAVKAYRLMKDDIDVEQLMDFYDRVSKTIT